MQPTVSILIPHFQTPTLTLLCLRLLRMKTRRPDVETIVIDNGSTDDSGASLRRLHWIRLLRRETSPSELPAASHGHALNLGVEHARAPTILTMHTDTMVLRSDWLDFLTGILDRSGPRCAAVGSWKMESPPLFRRVGKWAEDTVRWMAGRYRSKRRYIRSHCALYRAQNVRIRPAMFVPSPGRSAGEELHEAIVASGQECRFLPPYELCRYVRHLNHATMALNAHLGTQDPYMPRTRQRAIRRIRQFFDCIHADRVLADASLDQ